MKTAEANVITLNSVGIRYLEYIRKNLILPFIKESAAAKAMGWSVEDDKLVEYSSSCYEGIFPDSLSKHGHELIEHLDSCRRAMLNDEHVTSTCKEMATDAKMEDTFASMNQLVVPYANWRIACSEYLHVLAQSSSRTMEKFIKDSNPYKLYGAVMALSTMYAGTVSKEIGECLIMLLSIHLKKHGIALQ